MIGQRLEIRQGQGLVITPQLQQAIKLLQLSNLELEAFIEGEMERNPLLQRDEPEATGEAPEAAAASADSTELSFDEGRAAEGERTLDARDDDVYGDAAPGERTGDRAGDDAVQPGLNDWSRVGAGGSFSDGEGGERPDQRELTLSEHLQAQASSAGFSSPDMAIALTRFELLRALKSVPFPSFQQEAS